MAFGFDERDIDFCLFDHLGLGDMTRLAPYKEQDEELYRMVIREAQKFATERLWPANEESDTVGVRMENGTVKMPPSFPALYREYCEGGWNAVTVPEKLGGQGLPAMLGTAVTEMMGSGCLSFILTPGLTSGAIHVLEHNATTEQVQRYVDKMVAGDWAATMCLTEPNVGTFLGDIRTTAKSLGDGKYALKGTKMFISSGDHDLTENIVHIVLARAEGSPKGIKGLSLFIVPKVRTPGGGQLGEFNDIVCTKTEEKLGLHGSATCLMNFGDNDACVGEIIGNEGDGIALMFQMMNHARIGVGLQGVSLINTAYRLALDYAKERVQGTSVEAMKDPNAPRVTIIEHPDVRRMLMEIKAFGEAARALLYYCAKLVDTMNDPDETVARKARMFLDLLTPIAKAYPTDRSIEMTSQAIQVLGGVGYCREYRVEQLYREAKIGTIYEGTNGVQALDLVGRKLTQSGGALFMAYLQDLAEFIDTNTAGSGVGALLPDLAAARDRLVAVAMSFMEKGQSDPMHPVLAATPFLEAFGHIVSARLLTEQALIAEKKLAALTSAKGTDAASLAKENDEARYLYNKTLTAKFFARNILPRVDALATRIIADDRSCIEAEF
ncbi:acyl-CoA dehydrogenase [bacterium]|nr:acyl-CoA dehydrogenase [bacterium]